MAASPIGTFDTEPLPTAGLTLSITTTLVVGTIRHIYMAVAVRNQCSAAFQLSARAMMSRA
jgi:hypothetical protein